MLGETFHFRRLAAGRPSAVAVGVFRLWRKPGRAASGRRVWQDEALWGERAQTP